MSRFNDDPANSVGAAENGPFVSDLADGSTCKSGEAAALLSVNPVTVRRWADKGLLSYVRTSNGHYLYSLEEIRALRRRLTPEGSSFWRGRKCGIAGAIEHFVAVLFDGDASAAMLELAAHCGIAVHYLDRAWFADFLKQRGRTLTDEERKRVAGELTDYWAVIDDSCRKQIEAYADQVLQAAAVDQEPEPHPRARAVQEQET